MFAITSARVSRRITVARTRRQTASAERAYNSQPRTSLGETFAIGLGCDSWKPRHF